MGRVVMARRPPAAVRARLPVRPRENRPFSAIAGLPRRTLADIHRVEATELIPGEVEKALQNLRRYARIAHRRPEFPGCTHCAGADPDIRISLDRALHALPARSRAALQALLDRLDEEIRRKTFPDPHAPPGPWWDRRFNDLY
ncbi:hypothetical protein ACQPXB_43745 [Amycolatopsis sp. CA-161197]|uniref:hypothetical protein n=1 Tax=Amycolatopsis sp. CA-161197 TaxID=3239922 RepID=UPI003D8DBD80